MDIFRDKAQSHMALSTSSSFRQPIPPGDILEEELRTALPYTNVIYVFEMTGAQVQELLDHSASNVGSDFFSQVSGVRFSIVDGKATDVQVLNDPADPASGYSALDPAATYKVATTNYQGLYAGGYKDIFAAATYEDTGIDVRERCATFIQANSPVTASLDGRISEGRPRRRNFPRPAGSRSDRLSCYWLASLSLPAACGCGVVPLIGWDSLPPMQDPWGLSPLSSTRCLQTVASAAGR